LQPLVPKIRAGEVLRGTRNLRHWLRTSSILHNVEHLSRNGREFTDPVLSKGLYTPQKDDTFIVAANTPFHFCVWSARQNITLIFINPSGRHTQDIPPYMNPGLFATWFVRTNEYNLDLNKWPNFAYYLWGMVQMNSLALPNVGYALVLARPYVNPFRFYHDVNNAEVRSNVVNYSQQAPRWGRLRASGLKGWHT